VSDEPVSVESSAPEHTENVVSDEAAAAETKEPLALAPHLVEEEKKAAASNAEASPEEVSPVSDEPVSVESSAPEHTENVVSDEAAAAETKEPLALAPHLVEEEKKAEACPAPEIAPPAPPAPKTPEPITPQNVTTPAPVVRDVSTVSSISNDIWDDDTNASSVAPPQPSTIAPELPSKAGTMARGISALSSASSKASMMRHDVDFSFGLIAKRERAPGTGRHQPSADVYGAAVAGGTDDRVSTVDRYMAAAEGVVEEYLSNRAHKYRSENPFSDSSRVEDVEYDPDFPPHVLEIVDDVHYAPPANQSSPQRGGLARQDTIRRFVRAAVPVFVKKDNVMLAKRVRKELLDALRMAVMDGSFAQAASRPTTDEAFGRMAGRAR